ncbi:hypothetical protein ACF1AO_32510 [Streptomyces longwoodensis]|uniref:hypothetical protein n=1 Tax=Streptomyces longwoodensis TaxID=68231 RepID=UPI003702F404
MTTVLFVHGTGVRAKRYADSCERVEQGLAEALPGVLLARCAWGDVLGAEPAARAEAETGTKPGEAHEGETAAADGRTPQAEGPQEPGAADGTMREADIRRALWARLYDDPLFETRLLALESGATGAPARSVQRLRDRLAGLHQAPAVVAVLSAGAAPDLAAAVRVLLTDQEFTAALPALAAQWASDVLARAVTAAYVRVREGGDGTDPWVPVTERDSLEDAVVAALGDALSVAGAAREVAKATARHAAHHLYLKKRRERILERATPAVGDILAYQVRGGPLRRFVLDRLREIDGPVIVLGHSLGGIAAFETLVEYDLPNVRLLVTVGSQAPYFYGLDALATLRRGRPLPPHFPRHWLNVHDPVDLLSFPAEPHFGGHVTDVRVDTGEPFPRAHGAYWTTGQVYRALADAATAAR